MGWSKSVEGGYEFARINVIADGKSSSVKELGKA